MVTNKSEVAHTEVFEVTSYENGARVCCLLCAFLGFRDYVVTRTHYRPPACLLAASVVGAGASCASEAGAEVVEEPRLQTGPSASARRRAAMASSRAPAAAEQ